MLRVRFPLRQSQGHQDRQPPWHPCGGVGLLARLRLSGVLPRLPDRPHVCHGAAGHAPVRVRRRHVDGRRLPGHHRAGDPAAAEVVPALLPVGRVAFAVQRAEPDVPPPGGRREVPARGSRQGLQPVRAGMPRGHQPARCRGGRDHAQRSRCCRRSRRRRRRCPSTTRSRKGDRPCP